MCDVDYFIFNLVPIKAEKVAQVGNCDIYAYVDDKSLKNVEGYTSRNIEEMFDISDLSKKKSILSDNKKKIRYFFRSNGSTFFKNGEVEELEEWDADDPNAVLTFIEERNGLRLYKYESEYDYPGLMNEDVKALFPDCEIEDGDNIYYQITDNKGTIYNDTNIQELL